MRFQDLAIRRKLMVVIMLTTILAVLLASGAIYVYDYVTFREKIATDLGTLAETVRANTTNALVFNDRETADLILSGLSVQPHILGAWIFRQDGELFSQYRREGVATEAAPGGAEGTFLEDGVLVVARDVVFGDEVVGSLRIRSDLEAIEAWRRNYLTIFVVVTVGVTAVALFISALLQGVISRPVLDLVEVVRNVSAKKDYSVRVTKKGNDEIGRLIDGFNEMLGQIEQRDDELVVERDRAEQANRSKSLFLANMSHELRTPLTAIIGYSEILAEDARDMGTTDFLPDLEKIHAAGKHLLGLINSILDLSKVEAGKMELAPEKFEVAKLIEEVRSTTVPLMEKNRNTLEVHVGDSVGIVLNDLAKTRQILLNLLSNAAKFTEGGRIVLEAQRKAGPGTDLVVFRVSDSGIGMTPEQTQKLFKPFSQADASTARDYGGTGLGLALSKRFAELMHGRIKVESEHGKGSTFILDLPADIVLARLKTKSLTTLMESGEWDRSAAVRKLGADARLVLVIDDDLAVHELLSELLTREGFRVASARSGDEGLRMAREMRPAIITLDVRMPERDGWSVLTELKSDPQLAKIPVIMISVADEQRRGYALGAEYLTKPIDRARLAELLHKYRGANSTPVGLVVDDDANIRGVLSRLLREESWEVQEAEDGIAALRRVAEATPTLILLDLMMPRMDGFDFVAQLRKNTAWRHIPIVVVTAKDLDEEDRRRLNGGVEKILEKGAYSLDELKAEVCSLAHAVVAG